MFSLVVRPLCRGFAAAAVPVAATYAGGYIADCAIGAIADCIGRARGYTKITLPTHGMYMIEDGTVVHLDPAKKYEIVNGELREVVEAIDENWVVL